LGERPRWHGDAAALSSIANPSWERVGYIEGRWVDSPTQEFGHEAEAALSEAERTNPKSRIMFVYHIRYTCFTLFIKLIKNFLYGH